MSPSLPPELLEKIVDAHSQLPLDDDAIIPPGQQLSPSMLALHSTSRQLRHIMMRHMFHDIHICCGEVYKDMDKLRRLILPNSTTDLPFGSIGPHIKSLHIHIGHTYWFDNIENISSMTDELSQLFHVSLFDAILDQSPLTTLFLGGLLTWGTACAWDILPRDFQRTISSLIQLPTLRSFNLDQIRGLKAELFVCAPGLKELAITKTLEYELFDNPVAMQNLDIISLTIRSSGISEKLDLPTLQNLSATQLPSNCLDILWRVITSSWKNLTSLEIDDNYYRYSKNL